jgi:O-antigen/teichoic acid export membrane protein
MAYSALINEVFQPALRVGLACLAVLALGFGLTGVLGAYLLPIWLSPILAYHYFVGTFPDIRNRGVSPISEKRRFLDFSVPMLFVQFFGLWATSIDTLMLGHFMASREVGVYSAAQRTALVGNLIFISFNSIFAPIAADLHNRRELRLLGLYYKTVTKWMFTLSLPVYLILIVGADSFLLIFGREFVRGRSSLVALSLGWIGYSVTNSASSMLAMSGRQKLRVINMTGLLGLTLLLNVILIPRYGMPGAALAISISLSLFGLAELGQVYLLLKIHPFRKDFLKPLAAGGVAFLLSSLAWKAILGAVASGLAGLLLGALLFLGVYGGLIWLAGLQPEDKVVLKGAGKKIFGRDGDGRGGSF